MNGSDAFLDDMDGKVRESGWGVVYVGDDCDCMQCRAEGVTPQPSYLPSFAYTVGLTREYHHPEIVITGAPMDCATTLNEFGRRVRDGEVFSAGQRFTDIRRRYRRPAAGLADAANRLPWEHGCALSRGRQPLWGRPPAASRRRTAPAPRLRQRRLPPGPGGASAGPGH